MLISFAYKRHFLLAMTSCLMALHGSGSLSYSQERERREGREDERRRGDDRRRDGGQEGRMDEGRRWGGSGGQGGWGGREGGGQGGWGGPGGGAQGGWGGREGRPNERGGGDRRWDPEEFLKRMDLNGDGKLDSNELVGRTERYIAGLGFDTSKPVLLTAVVEKVRADRGESPTGGSATSSTPKPKVPGFGSTNEKVPNFGSNANEQSLETLFSNEIIQQVDWIMQTYDKNQDGSLDESEMAAIPAGPPPLIDSDTNRDGKLSRLELAYRYRAREQFSRQNEGNAGRDQSGRSDNEQSSRNRGRFSAEPSNISGSSRRAVPMSGAGGSSSSDRSQRDGSASEDDISKTIKYVENIFEKYDLDKDGQLSAKEAAEIRNGPKVDPDGFLTKEGYVDFVTNLSGSKAESNTVSSPSSASSVESNSAPQSSRTNRFSNRNTGNSRGATGNTRESSSDSGANSRSRNRTTFEDFDENGNGMIEMHEYAEEWNDKVLEEFYKKDKNRDGVITRQEWNG